MEKEITKDQLEEAMKVLEKHADKVKDSMFLHDRKLASKMEELRNNLEQCGSIKLKNPVFKRVEDKSAQEESKKLDKEELYKVAKETSDKFEEEEKKDIESFKKFIDYSKDLLKDDPESIKNLELSSKILLEEEVEPTEDEIELFESVTDQQVQSVSGDLSVKDLARKLSDLAGKPTMEELKPAVRYLKDLSEKVAGLNLDMADKMSGSEKADMASKLNKLILDNKLTEDDFDGIVLCGFPKDSIQMWKELYKPANERKKREPGVGSFRRIEQPVMEELSSVEGVELGSVEKVNAILDTVKENSLEKIGCKKIPESGYWVPAPTAVLKQFNDLCEGFENVQKLVDATPAKGIKILSTLRMFLDQLIKLVEENSDYYWGDCVMKYGKWLSEYEQELSVKSVEKNESKKLNCQCNYCIPTESNYRCGGIGKVLQDGSVVQAPTPVEKCTDCGSPERNMTELKTTASTEQQKEIQRQIRLGETIEFQNQIKTMIDHMKNLKTTYDVFYSGEYFDRIKSIFDWATERTPIATIEIKYLAELLQACANWHKNNSIFPNMYYFEWFKQRIEWLETQKDINSKTLQGMLSDNDSLLDNLKEKKLKCNCDENSECSNCPSQGSKDDCVMEFTDEDNSISADEIRSVDAFGDVSDKPKNPVVMRNIKEIAKKQRDERQSRRDRLKEYRVKTENEWKNSINNTQRILEKKNKPKELSGYEQKVVEKQDKKSKFNQLIHFISHAAKNGLISNSDAKKNIKYYKLLNSEGPDKAEKFLDDVKNSNEQASSKPMFDLSLWQKTKVYFRDLKNKASTLFKSPEITEEEVDRAIRLMEKQIAEIKKSKGISPDLLRQAFDQKFDYLLPRKDQKYRKQSEEERTADMMSSFGVKETKPTCSNNKVLLDKESKEQLSEYKGVIRCCNSDSIFIDDELRNEEDFYLTENKLYNLHKELMHNFNCFCEEEQYPYLRNLHNKIEKYHSRISLKKETSKFKEFIDVYSDFLFEIELLIK